MTPTQIQVGRLVELVTRYREGLDVSSFHAGWSQLDYQLMLVSACGFINLLTKRIETENGLEPGEALTEFALIVQLNEVLTT